LLTGERGHYELAAGRDVQPFIRALECFATSTKLLPEQVWALPDQPKSHMYLGRPTGGAMPLAWAHAEYIQLVRSAADGQIFGLIAEVSERYRRRRQTPPLEIWKFNRQVRSLPAGGTLRIQAASPFRLHWTSDEWAQVHDTDSAPIGTGHEFLDIRVPGRQRAPIRFTFFWTSASRWEGRDFQVGVEEERGGFQFNAATERVAQQLAHRRDGASRKSPARHK
jgi:glucoamylase